jgi:NADPH:quinone reductase-like Zn-dependent oxidoreductase
LNPGRRRRRPRFAQAGIEAIVDVGSVSWVGSLDAGLASARKLNVLLKFVFGLMSRRIMRLATRREGACSFLLVRPDGAQLAEIGELFGSGRVQPVIDKVFAFGQAPDALAYLAQGRSKGKAVVQSR